MFDLAAAPHFIFMLTRQDRTVADAARHLETALDAGVRHIGFKDIGLPFDALASLTQRIKSAGATAYLEVVSLDRSSEIASVKAGIGLGVDHILGGVNVADILPLLKGSSIGYFPFPGHVHGHPSVLEGTIAEIAASAADLARQEGVTGLDLLAWRSKGDVPALIEAVCKAARKPVIVAGSIHRPQQIATLRAAGAAGFTVGTAVLDEQFLSPATGIADQLKALLQM
jgi:hypothetical protein